MLMESIALFKALSDETRFRLLQLLLTRDLCVGALAYQLKISEAAVSQHLKQLRKVGLVKGEKRGYWTHYLVEKNRLNDLGKILEELTHLAPRPETGCLRNIDGKLNTKKEGKTMCGYKCQHPEKLKGNPKECTPRQIEKCHGSKKNHPCVGKGKKK
jgi:DNA-binding transcriptional ArsR family regulator